MLLFVCRRPEEASRSLMEMHGEEALRAAVRGLGAPGLASELIQSSLRLLKEQQQQPLAAAAGLLLPGGPAAAEAAAAAPNAESELPPEELLFSPSSPLRCVKVHFPFEEFRRAGECLTSSHSSGGPQALCILLLQQQSESWHLEAPGPPSCLHSAAAAAELRLAFRSSGGPQAACILLLLQQSESWHLELRGAPRLPAF